MRRHNAALLITAVTVLFAAGVVTVRAQVPSGPPLYYAGTLTANGSPVTGIHAIGLALWDAPVSGANVCPEMIHAGVDLSASAGRFRLALDGDCGPAVQANPELWLELKANGNVVGRSALGAVPTAVLSTRALTAGNADTATAAVNGVPSGTVVAFAGESPPAGWLECDGAGLASATYPNLFAAIGATWGNGSGTAGANFNLPDLRGRAAIGAGQGIGLQARFLGQSLGAEKHSLSEAEMASHSHSVTDSGHLHTMANPIACGTGSWTSGGNNWACQVTNPPGQATTLAISNVALATTGSGSAHNVMQPSTVVRFIIKY